MGRLIDADEYEKRIKPYDTEDVMDKALYNFAHEKLITTSTAEPTEQVRTSVSLADCISRQAAIDALCKRCDLVNDDTCGDKCIDIKIIEKLPSAEPERKHGRWIHILTEPDGNALYECSECHKGEVHVPIVEVHYCWNCGARMDGESE